MDWISYIMGFGTAIIVWLYYNEFIGRRQREKERKQLIKQNTELLGTAFFNAIKKVKE